MKSKPWMYKGRPCHHQAAFAVHWIGGVRWACGWCDLLQRRRDDAGDGRATRHDESVETYAEYLKKKYAGKKQLVIKTMRKP
jgi:hypothetical protein